MTIDAGLKPEGAPERSHSWRRRPLGRRCRTEALSGPTQDGGGGAFVAGRTVGCRRPGARLRVAGVRSSPRRVRRVMGENGWLAPHRVGRNQEKTHDGTIVTDKINEMWGTDMSQTVTLEEGRAYVFVAVEHANSEIVGIHAARSA